MRRLRISGGQAQAQDQTVDRTLSPDATFVVTADMAGMVHVWKFRM